MTKIRDMLIALVLGIALVASIPLWLQPKEDREAFWTQIRAAQHALGFSNEFASRNLSPE